MDMAGSVMILFFHICVHDSSVWYPKSAGSSCEGCLCVWFFFLEKGQSLWNREMENTEGKILTPLLIYQGEWTAHFTDNRLAHLTGADVTSGCGWLGYKACNYKN